MSALDAVLLGSALLAAVLWIFAGERLKRTLRWAPVTLGVLAGVQLVTEGYYWQFLPLYVLIALMAVLALRGRAGWLSRTALGLAALASLGVWAVLAVPVLPAPKGPHAVGSATYRWVDASRREDATDDPADRRNVVAQAFYPTAPNARGPHSVYMDGIGRMPPKVTLLPGFIFESFGRVQTHALAGASVSTPKGPWPVVIFSPGYGAPRAFYTSLAADLASRGFVVMVLDHPYESPAVELADGSLATPIERFLPNDPDRTRYMETRIQPRVGDVSYALDRLAAGRDLGPLGGGADLQRVAVVGHSFGGATAALALARDPRLKAGADVDGMLYGGVEAVSLGRPFLVIESDRGVTKHPQLYLQRVESLFGRLGAPAYRYEIKGANHFSFTDAEQFFAPPARPLTRRIFGGSRPSAQTLRITADLLESFLRASLTAQAGVQPQLPPGVVGGPVRP